MKTYILYLIILLLNGFTGFSQEIINNPGMDTNEAIHQIRSPGINDILGFQTLNQGFRNNASIHQAGHQNKATVNQQAEHGLGFSNQSFSFQEGNFNEMTLGQIGSGNVLLSFQLGYLSNSLSQSNLFGFGLESSIVSAGTFNESNTLLAFGERNELQVSQEGSNNGIMAIQQGSDNVIDVGQKGSNNYLAILQKGSKNSVKGYVQENTDASFLFNADTSSLFETVTQVGDHLSLLATDVSGAKAMGNVIKQSGVNLSLEVNNGLVNTLGGIEITQTGRDMKVVVDQSFFSFPMQ